jgi:hypothetical protein
MNPDIVGAFVSHRDTMRLPVIGFRKVFDYLKDLFPDNKELIENVVIYKNSNIAFSSKMGLEGVAGLYLPSLNSVFILYSKNFTDDEVLVHEVLHYLSKAFGSSMIAASAEEVFAYKKSVEYLRKNGRSEEFIIGKYLLPFFLEMEMKKGKSYNRAEEDARREAKCLLSEEFLLENRKEEADSDDTSRFEDL